MSVRVPIFSLAILFTFLTTYLLLSQTTSFTGFTTQYTTSTTKCKAHESTLPYANSQPYPSLYHLYTGLSTYPSYLQLSPPTTLSTYTHGDDHDHDLHDDSQHHDTQVISTKRQQWMEKPFAFHCIWDIMEPYQYTSTSTSTSIPCQCRPCIHKLVILIKSFLATQDLSRSTLTIWLRSIASHTYITQDELIQPYVSIIRFRVLRYDHLEQAKPELKHVITYIQEKDGVEAPSLHRRMMGFLLLYLYGGIYIQPDTLLLNDWSPLLTSPFISISSCISSHDVGVMYIPLSHREIVWDMLNQQMQQQDITIPTGTTISKLDTCYFYPDACSEDMSTTTNPDNYNYFHSPRDRHTSTFHQSWHQLYLDRYAYHYNPAGTSHLFAIPIELRSRMDETQRYMDQLLILKYGDIPPKSTSLDRSNTAIPACFLPSHTSRALRIMGYTILILTCLLVMLHVCCDRGLIKTRAFIQHTCRMTILSPKTRGIAPSSHPSIWATRRAQLIHTLRHYRYHITALILFITLITLSLLYYFIWSKRSSCSFGAGGAYAIGIYFGTSPYDLHDRQVTGDTQGDVPKNPVITKHSVLDHTARFVADPFLVLPTAKDPNYYLFFESQNANKGEIAMATSTNANTWVYQGVVLDEPFHLSYPYVFSHADHMYMIPETHESMATHIYIATAFPRGWIKAATIVENGDYADSSIFTYEGRWYLFTMSADGDSLLLFHSDELLKGWSQHPKSPILSHDMQYSRPAGRVVIYQQAERLSTKHIGVRFSMDNTREYGESVSAHPIISISRDDYVEHTGAYHELMSGCLKNGKCTSNVVWNSNNMHHVDAHQLRNGEWIAAVDGCGFGVR